jgi:tetratricopeptide (TPR) repeat protein
MKLYLHMKGLSVSIIIVLFFLVFIIIQPTQEISQMLSVNESSTLNNVTLPNNKSQMYDRAMKFYDKALSISPNNTDTITNKGILLIKLAKYDESLLLFDNILHMKPDNVGALYNKGVALDKLGRHQEAMKYYASAYKIDPRYKGDFINILSVSPSIATSKSEKSSK